MDGYVSLRVTRTTVTIVKRHRVRFLLFWKRWRTDVLASKQYEAHTGDHVQLHSYGDRWAASINGDIVVTSRAGTR